MSRNRKVALMCFILAFLAAIWLLKCSEQKPPVKNPTEERRRMDPKPDPEDWYQKTGNPKPPPQQPPD